MKTTHIAFSDESKHNTGRYRSIGMVSMPAHHVARIAAAIDAKLMESDVLEVKWKKIKGARDRFAAIKVLEICVQEARERNIRIDVLIWDTEDQRHKIIGRDDNANLQNMYIQLFKNVLRKRWPIESIWQLFPDENSILDWDYLRNTLANTDRFTEKAENLFDNEWLDLRSHYNVTEIAEVCSNETALTQAADLFAGMAVFSYEQRDTFQAWNKQHSQQIELLPSTPANFSRKEEEHANVLNIFLQNVSKYRLGILNKYGLATPNPSYPINFWFYQSQRSKDKAPVRQKRSR